MQGYRAFERAFALPCQSHFTVIKMKLRSAFVAAVLVLGAAQVPGYAQTAPAAAVSADAIKVNAWVKTVDGKRIGRISSVQSTSISVIAVSRIISIPISTLSLGDKGLVTSLTRADISKL